MNNQERKICLCLLEAEGYLGPRYEDFPPAVRWYLITQAAAQLVYSPKKGEGERRKIARRAFSRALMGLWRTLHRKTSTRTRRFSPLLRRLAAADYFAWRKIQLVRESELPEWKPYPAEANWKKYWERGGKEVIQEDVQIEKLGLDIETLAQLALEENIIKYRKKQEKKKFTQVCLFPGDNHGDNGHGRHHARQKTKTEVKNDENRN